jgi:hypothetical protein
MNGRKKQDSNTHIRKIIEVTVISVLMIVCNLGTLPVARANSSVLDWTTTLEDKTLSSPVIYNIDFDPEQEIIINSKSSPYPSGGYVYILNYSREIRKKWYVDSGVPMPNGGLTGHTSPSIVDLDGDGLSEIIVETGGFYNYAYHQNGSIVEGWPYDDCHGLGPGFTSILSSPVVADLNNDGNWEIIIHSLDKLFILKDNGNEFINPIKVGLGPEHQPDWPFNWTFWTPAVADFDHDNDLEVVLFPSKVNESGKYYYAQIIHHDGTNLSSWQLNGTDPDSWRYYFYVPGASLGDLDGDGDIEIIYAIKNNSATMICARHYDGSSVTNFPVVINKSSNTHGVVLGNLDCDNGLEIVMKTIVKSDKTGYIYLIDDDGDILNSWCCNKLLEYNSEPLIADINDDGVMDIICGCEDGLYAWDQDGNLIEGFPKETDGKIISTPAIGDIDQDGSTEIQTFPK